MAIKSGRKPLQAAVSVPRQPLPTPEIGLEALESAAREMKIHPASQRAQQEGKVAGKPPLVGDGKPKRLSVDLDSELFANFKAWCAVNRTTIKEKVVQMIRETVAGG